MAKFIGTSGGFQEERAESRRLKALTVIILAIWAMTFILGYASALFSIWWGLVAVVIVFPGMWLLRRWLEEDLRKLRKDEAGADGEHMVCRLLRDLPDDYTVISDLEFVESYGNIDHLVIGPSGVFAIDVKNWRGTVSSDGKGELLLNGRPTDKPMVRNFTRRAMDLRERLKALTKLDPYVQCVFAFPHTRVEANWGTTGAVHCIRAEQVAEYITKRKGGHLISPSDIPRLVAAVNALRELASDMSP